MRFTKRILAFLLCAMMIVTALPMGALDIAAEEATDTASAEAAETQSRKQFHVHLDFDDVGTSVMSSYVPSKIAGTGVKYVGSDAWVGNTENGNSYISLNQADQTTFTFSAPDLFTGNTIEIRFDTRLSYNKSSGTGALFFPLVRFSPGTSTSSGTANALVLKTPASVSKPCQQGTY